MLKIVHIDTETTGKNPARHSIHQLAGKIEVDGSVVETFDIKIKPYFPFDEKTDEALSISGVTKRDISTYPVFLKGLQHFVSLLAKYVDMWDNNDKFFLSGYGVSHFDKPFLKALFEVARTNTFENWFFSVPLDSMVLAAHVLRNERSNMHNFKLETVARRFNIDVDQSKLHNACYDVDLHFSLYKCLCNMPIKQN